MASFAAGVDPGRPASVSATLAVPRSAAGERRGQPLGLLGEHGQRALRAGALEPADERSPAPCGRRAGGQRAGAGSGREPSMSACGMPGTPQALNFVRTRNVTSSPSRSTPSTVTAAKCGRRSSMSCDVHAGHHDRTIPRLHARHASQRRSRDHRQSRITRSPTPPALTLPAPLPRHPRGSNGCSQLRNYKIVDSRSQPPRHPRRPRARRDPARATGASSDKLSDSAWAKPAT